MNRPPPVETAFENIPSSPRERHEFFLDLFGRYLFWAMQEAMSKSEKLVSSPEARARLGRALEQPYREMAELNLEQKKVAFNFAKQTMENAVKNILIILGAEGITFKLGEHHAVQFRLIGEIRDVEEMEIRLEETINRGPEKAFTSYWGRWLRQNSGRVQTKLVKMLIFFQVSRKGSKRLLGAVSQRWALVKKVNMLVRLLRVGFSLWLIVSHQAILAAAEFRLSLPDEAALITRGDKAYADGEWESAIESYGRALASNSNSATAYARRAAAYQAKGDTDHAISDNTAAIRIDPTNVAALFNRATCYRVKGRLDLTIRDLSECLSVNPTNELAYKFRAQAFMLLGQFDKAIRDWTEGLRRV